MSKTNRELTHPIFTLKYLELENAVTSQLPRVCCIYKIKNNLNGKVYIGQTINLYKRYPNHKSGKSSLFIHGAFRKYGFENFSTTILEICEKDKDILNEREKHWIEYYDTCNKEKGYNYSTIGRTQLGHSVSAETRAKFSKLMREKFKDPTKNPFYGKSHSAHTIDKIKETLRQRLLSGKTNAKKVNQLDPTSGEVLNTFPSIKDAAKSLGLKGSSGITAAINHRKQSNGNGIITTAGGYKWQFAN